MLIRCLVWQRMPSSSLKLLKKAIDRSPHSLRHIADELAWDAPHLSRVLSGQVGLGATSVARFLVFLDPATAEHFLSVYLQERVAAEETAIMEEKTRAIADIAAKKKAEAKAARKRK